MRDRRLPPDHEERQRQLPPEQHPGRDEAHQSQGCQSHNLRTHPRRRLHLLRQQSHQQPRRVQAPEPGHPRQPLRPKPQRRKTKGLYPRPLPKRLMAESNFIGSKSNPFPDAISAIAGIDNWEHKVVENRKESGLFYISPTSSQFVPFGMPASIDNIPPGSFVVTATTPNSGNIHVPESARRHYYKFKPNLWHRAFLYRGQNGDYAPCKPSMFRYKKSKKEHYYLKECIINDEFEILIFSLPLVWLLTTKGVKIGGRHPIHFGTDFYGLSQHYGNKTSLLDLTSDISAALFFSCTTYDSAEHKYKPLSENHLRVHPLGVIYAYDILNPDFAISAFKDGTQLSAIGKQLFKNPGCQNGFLIDLPINTDFEKLLYLFPVPDGKGNITREPVKRVHKFYFRHDKALIDLLYEKSVEGKIFAPGDILQRHWDNVLDEMKSVMRVSYKAIESNLRRNPKETVETLTKKLKSLGFEITEKSQSFSDNELREFYYELNNGGWDNFCSDIVFPGSDGHKYWNAFHDLPSTPEYRDYFKFN